MLSREGKPALRHRLLEELGLGGELILLGVRPPPQVLLGDGRLLLCVLVVEDVVGFGRL